jgi:hypothetical protein
VDKVMVFEGLEYDTAVKFIEQVWGTFKQHPAPTPADIKAVANKAFAGQSLTQGSPQKATQAALTEAVYAYVKLHGTKLVLVA